ncbi:Uncharacterised protein [Vibrio cholerae]|nr:Uncharacterised protein [Vibrio cholerae]CRZ94138.1 Uncharacterised protein [Vibrio cholerae]CSB03772.1 Uncharacterised protein [Vibrio cholerae]CSB24417.1 Uncharacterised protein [Vibrio cholerae]
MNVARIVSPRKPDHGCYKSQSRHLAGNHRHRSLANL